MVWSSLGVGEGVDVGVGDGVGVGVGEGEGGGVVVTAGVVLGGWVVGNGAGVVTGKVVIGGWLMVGRVVWGVDAVVVTADPHPLKIRERSTETTIRIKMNFRISFLLPLDSRRRLRSYIINDPVDAGDLINDTVGDAGK